MSHPEGTWAPVWDDLWTTSKATWFAKWKGPVRRGGQGWVVGHCAHPQKKSIIFQSGAGSLHEKETSVRYNKTCTQDEYVFFLHLFILSKKLPSSVAASNHSLVKPVKQFLCLNFTKFQVLFYVHHHTQTLKGTICLLWQSGGIWRPGLTTQQLTCFHSMYASYLLAWASRGMCGTSL